MRMCKYIYIFTLTSAPFLLRCRPCLSRLNEIGNKETNLDPKTKSPNSSNGARHPISGQTQKKECPPCPLESSPHRGYSKHATLDPLEIARTIFFPGFLSLALAIETFSLGFRSHFFLFHVPQSCDWKERAQAMAVHIYIYIYTYLYIYIS